MMTPSIVTGNTPFDAFVDNHIAQYLLNYSGRHTTRKVSRTSPVPFQRPEHD